MKKTGRMTHVKYTKEDIAELQNASVKVHHIYTKALSLIQQYLPDSLWYNVFGVLPEKIVELRNAEIEAIPAFQQWIQGPKGWKFIGCDLEESEIQNDSFDQGVICNQILQALIWSQYEQIKLLHPILKAETFYSREELETISKYVVPTYYSNIPFVERGTLYKERSGWKFTIKDINAKGPVVYQEYVPVPQMDSQEHQSLNGPLLTGVYVKRNQFFGLGPYVRDTDGHRNYLEVMVQ
ncbi:hypothetical protein PASE110613_02115 [Paenibacillus sediminis]|uniref:Uncharacterized protein n=1 Tax=Paenibacillus sediminis TaxID=664909 RepID=A0ABS4GZB5_9BACL|nr:hypothetical protein [Paenibacillus sediminis]MBP1935618.1 hypothetical protein [Paenibacillus sediminis]